MKYKKIFTSCFTHHTLPLGYNGLFVCIQMFKRDSGSLRHAEKCVFGERRFDAGTAKYKFWKIAKLLSTASHDDSPINDVR